MPVKTAVCPGTRVVLVPEHVPPGFDRSWHVAVTPPAGAVGTSVTTTPVRVTFPVLVTVKVYVTVWPAALIVEGLADLTMESEATGSRRP